MDPRKPPRQQVVPAHGEGHPALAEHQDQHYHREPDEYRKGDDQLSGREGRHFEGRGRRGRCGQVLVWPEPGKDYGCQDIENGAYCQGSEDPDGHIPLGVAWLLSGGGDDVEADVGEEDQRRRCEDAGDAECGVYPQKTRQYERLKCRLRRRGRLLRWRDEGREVRGLYEEYPEAYDEQRNEDLDPGDHLVELGAQSYAYDQDGRHERDHDQRHEVVGEACRRGVEPRRQLYPEDFEHADEVSRPSLGHRGGAQSELQYEVPPDKPCYELSQRSV